MEKGKKHKSSAWRVKGKGSPIIEVLESFTGDLYFITEKNGAEIFCFARLRHDPQMAEWGYSDIDYLKEAYGKNMIWNVAKKHWSNINSYEDGLFVSDV